MTDTAPATRYTSCNLCDAMCGLQVRVQGGRIVDLRGDPDDPHSRGHVCSKAYALKELHEDPDRLRAPLVRQADGQLRPAPWSEALDLAARRIRHIQRQHGRDAVALYIGNPSAHSHRTALGAQLLTMALGSRNRYDANSQDGNPRLFACMAAYGDALAMPVPDVDRMRFLLMLGSNPAASNGSQMGLGNAKERLTAIARRGGKLVLIDPRRTETAAWCQEHHFIHPGGDAALLLAMLHVIATENLADPAFVATRTKGSAELFAVAARFAPDQVAARIGIGAATIARIAREFASHGPACAFVRVGVCNNAFGPLASFLAEALNAVTGNLGRAGGALFAKPAADIAPLGRMLIGNHYGRWHSRVRQLPEFLGALPSGALAEEIATPGKGQIKALVCLAGNPVLSVPGGQRLVPLLQQLQFFAAIDIYAGATAQHAHVILPPCHAFETQRYDLLLNRFGVRTVARYDEAILPRPDGALDDWQIAAELAMRLRLPRWLHGPARALLRDYPERTVQFLLKTGGHELTIDKLLAAPHGLDLGALPEGVDGQIHHPDGRVDLAAPHVLCDADRLQQWLDAPPPPLQLIGRRHVRDCNSWLHNLPSTAKGPNRAAALLNPADLRAAALQDGDTAELASEFGAVVATIQQSDAVMAGVVCLPHGFGHGQVPGLGIAGRQTAPNANALTDPSQVEPLVGQSILNGVAVRVQVAHAS